MKGLWIWPENEGEQEKLMNRIKSSKHFITILSALLKNAEGLSNSQIDFVTKSSSQWSTRWFLSELLGLGLVEYKVDLFGGPGKYTVTELGKSILQKISSQQQAKPMPH